MPSEVSYGVLPIRKNSGSYELFLVHHKNGDFWGFPKGHPNPGESPIQTATRELLEETNLSIEKILTLQPYSEKYSFQRDGQRIEKEVHYYSALVTGRGESCQKELNEARWFPLNKVEEILTFPEAKKILNRLKEDLT